MNKLLAYSASKKNIVSIDRLGGFGWELCVNTEHILDILNAFPGALDTFSEGFYVLDKDWHYVYVNQRAAELVGKPREAFIGREFWQLFPKALEQQFAGTLHKAMQEHTQEHIEAFYPPLQKWFVCRCYPVNMHLVIIVQDVTMNKLTMEQLREKSALLDICDDAIIVHNYEGRILFWNAGAEELYGWTAAEVIDKNVHDLLETRFSGTLEEVRTQLRHKERWEGELIHRRKDGSHISVDSRWAARRDIYGQDIVFLEANRDITERKELEQRKNEFISMASHELKTPITSIKAFTQLLIKRLQPLGDQQVDHFLNRMNDQINRLTRLVNELLDISRAEAGKLTFSDEVFDLHEILRVTVENMRMAESRHTLLYEGIEGIMLRGDQDRIGQVLLNLLNNAIKYSPRADKVVIRLSTTLDEVTVSIQDFGIGIAPANHQKIFERFYQAEQIERNFPGLGIGLYICREIIQRHHGRLWVESQLGAGATFSFTLPLWKPEESAERGV